MHPDHSQQLSRLNRIEGQIKGVKKMIAEQRYCVDILTQTKAVRAALHKVEQNILRSHMQHCLRAAVASGDPLELNEKLEEIMDLLDKRI